MNDHVNTKEAREMLRITATTLRTWDKLGKIKTTRTPTGIRLYSRKSIQEILTKNGMNCKPFLEQAMQGKISEVLVSHRDRLCGYCMFQLILNQKN